MRITRNTTLYECAKGVLLFVLQDVRPESPGSNLTAIGNFSFLSGERFCYARVRPPSQPRRSLEWRLGEEIGPSYAVGSSVSRGSNGAIACYLCAALPPFMPPAAAGDATASEHRGGGVRARRARRRRRAAAGGSAAALAASLARPLPLRALGALPTWGSMIFFALALTSLARTCQVR